MKRLFQAGIVLMTIMLTGCQAFYKGHEAAQEAPRVVESSQDDRYYELMRPGDTSLKNVTDDGANMYLAFKEPLPEKVQLFDTEGQPLVTARDGALLGIAGLHQGLLIRSNENTSYVGVREGAVREAAPQAANTPAVAAMRERLSSKVAAIKAMKRALAAVEAREQAEREAAKKAALAIDKNANSARPSRSTAAMLKIFFDFDAYRTDLSMMRKSERDELMSAPRVMVVGHTDSVGSVNYNLKLGLRRAKFIATRLASEGIDPRRMTLESKGEAEPMATNATAAGRAKNRRVELILDALAQ